MAKARAIVQRRQAVQNIKKITRTMELIATAKRMKADGHTARDIAKYLGGSRATLYRYLADDAA